VSRSEGNLTINNFEVLDDPRDNPTTKLNVLAGDTFGGFEGLRVIEREVQLHRLSAPILQGIALVERLEGSFAGFTT
jgi:hypothetical protein